MALKACVGIALSQPGNPNVAGIGGGIIPSSPAGQRNLSFIDSLLLGTIFLLLRGPPFRQAVAPSLARWRTVTKAAAFDQGANW
jgi:hypothetical protein